MVHLMMPIPEQREKVCLRELFAEVMKRMVLAVT